MVAERRVKLVAVGQIGQGLGFRLGQRVRTLPAHGAAVACVDNLAPVGVKVMVYINTRGIALPPGEVGCIICSAGPTCSRIHGKAVLHDLAELRILHARLAELADGNAVRVRHGNKVEADLLQHLGHRHAVECAAVCRTVQQRVNLLHGDGTDDILSPVDACLNQNLFRSILIADDDIVDGSAVQGSSDALKLYQARIGLFHVIQVMDHHIVRIHINGRSHRFCIRKVIIIALGKHGRRHAPVDRGAGILRDGLGPVGQCLRIFFLVLSRPHMGCLDDRIVGRSCKGYQTEYRSRNHQGRGDDSRNGMNYVLSDHVFSSFCSLHMLHDVSNGSWFADFFSILIRISKSNELNKDVNK